MAPVIAEVVVAPLRRTTRGGDVLRRPARIEAEIAGVLELDPGEILARAAAGPEAVGTMSEQCMPEQCMSEQCMSEECMVHLIRRDLRVGSRRLAEGLTPLLLERCDASLKRSIRGFPASVAVDIREEVLGRLAVSLAGPGKEADFLEVRFALALKRLRIDVCRHERRRLRGLIALEEVSAGGAWDDPEPTTVDRTPPSPPAQEDRLLIRQALASLTPEERKVLVLHKLAGVPLSSTIAAGATLVALLGRSERTLRNRLRSAEAKLVGIRAQHRREYSRGDRG